MPATAQNGPCNEQSIRDLGKADHTDLAAEDMYFFSGAIDKPVVGTDARKQTAAPVAAARTHEKEEPLKPERIVAASSGEMAYEYGTAHVSFDNKKDGKHVDFTAAHLRVWKAVDGKCKIAAEMFEPEGQ
jgi:ketosteroid isomerase-like protein